MHPVLCISSCGHNTPLMVSSQSTEYFEHVLKLIVLSCSFMLLEINPFFDLIKSSGVVSLN